MTNNIKLDNFDLNSFEKKVRYNYIDYFSNNLYNLGVLCFKFTVDLTFGLSLDEKNCEEKYSLINFYILIN